MGEAGLELGHLDIPAPRLDRIGKGRLWKDSREKVSAVAGPDQGR